MKIFPLIAIVVCLSSASFARPKSSPVTYDVEPVSSYTFGNSYTHEISTNLTGATFSSSKSCSACSSVTNLTFEAEYLHSWQKNMQYGLEAQLRNISSGGTGLTLVGIGTYNMSHDFKNALYFKGGLGIYGVQSGAQGSFESKFGFFLGVGKRFNWLSNIAFDPEFRIEKIGDLDFSIKAALLNFSIFWN